MRYYCKNCGSQLTVGDRVLPEDMPFEVCDMECKLNFNHGNMELIPDYETPGQYKKRTGKRWPDMGLVWERHKFKNGCEGTDWELMFYSWAQHSPSTLKTIRKVQIVCAAFPYITKPPPDDWRQK